MGTTTPTVGLRLPRQARSVGRSRAHGALAAGRGVEAADWDDGTQSTACTDIYGWPSDQCEWACSGALGGIPGDLCTPTYDTTGY